MLLIRSKEMCGVYPLLMGNVAGRFFEPRAVGVPNIVGGRYVWRTRSTPPVERQSHAGRTLGGVVAALLAATPSSIEWLSFLASAALIGGALRRAMPNAVIVPRRESCRFLPIVAGSPPYVRAHARLRQRSL